MMLSFIAVPWPAANQLADVAASFCHRKAGISADAGL